MAEMDATPGTPVNDTLHKPVEVQPPMSVVIYQGPVSMWIAWKAFLIAIVLELVALGSILYSTTLGSGTPLQTPLLIGGVALFAASGIMLAYVIINVKTMRYKITNKLIERESGILVKRIDALDLGRVKDVQLAQTVIDRMVNIGTIEVFSTDRTDPVMLVEAIPGARAVYEKLRDSVIEISQRRGVVPMN
jgi:membrane protein YdbS with pleckstrin-like domain